MPAPDTNSMQLRDTLATISQDQVPHALPAGHVTRAEHLGSIVRNMALVPQPCRYFQEDLTYLFYGGLFYRSSRDATDDILKLPVGFLFAPSLLRQVDRYYPMDSGAVHSQRVRPPRHTRRLLHPIGGRPKHPGKARATFIYNQ